jgi:hypothetical protein
MIFIQLIISLISITLSVHVCEPPLTKEYLEDVSTIAIIKVNGFDANQREILVAATRKVFKGSEIDQINVSDAEVDFKIGREYLAYVNKDRIIRCSRTMALSEAGPDIEFLNANLKCIDSTLISTNGGCLRYFTPVCGCDNQTYGNSCEARQHGVAIYTIGTCK